MSYNNVRFQLDPTGINPNNRITGEIHSLTAKDIRAVALTYGPFFAKNIQVYDNNTGALLSRGIDYQLTELHQETSLKYGQEIISVILIINKNVSPEIRVNYNVLGGHFTNDSTAIANMYQAVINDNRPVQWENVLNKPLEYPPALHRHLLEDVYGFEAVVDAIERLRNAITLNNVPLIEAYFDYIQSLLGGLRCEDVRYNLPNKKVVTYDSLLAVLTRLNVLSSYTLDNYEYAPKQAQSFKINIRNTKTSTDNSSLYWFVFTYNNHVTPITPNHGRVTLVNSKASIIVNIPGDVPKDTKRFIIGIKDSQGRVDFIAVSCEFEAFTYSDVNAEHDDITDIYMSLNASDDHNVGSYLDGRRTFI